MISLLSGYRGGRYKPSPRVAADDDRPFRYYACCVDLDGDDPGEAIRELKYDARDITYATIKRWCAGLEDWERMMGYEQDRRRGLTLKADFLLASTVGCCVASSATSSATRALSSSG